MSSVKKPKPPRRPSSPDDVRNQPIDWTWLYAPAAWLLLTLAVTSAYWNSFRGLLFFDDISSIENNPHLQAFNNPTIGDFWERLKFACGAQIDTPFAGRPIVSLSFALNHWWAFNEHPSTLSSFYGVMPQHIWYYHFVNFCFHLLDAILLWHLLRFTFRSPGIRAYTGRHAELWATAVALIWSVHPLNTETVVYITQRTELILSCFLLFTIYAGGRSNVSPVPWAWQLGSVAACTLGMASKENMVAAPLLLVLYDRAFFYTSWRAMFLRRWGFYLAIFATYGMLAYINAAGFKIGTGFRAAPEFEEFLSGGAIALLMLKHLLRVTAVVLAAFFIDRLLLVDSWRETIARRGKFYATAFVGLLALVILQEVVSTVTPKSMIDKIGNNFAKGAQWEWVSDLTMWLILRAPFVLAAAVVLVAGDFWASQLSRQELARRTKYYLTLIGLLMLVYLKAEAGPRGLSVGFHFERMNWWQYLITQCWCLLRYLRLSVLPIGLCVDYGRLAILDPGAVLPGALVILTLLGLTVWGWIYRPWVGFLGCWFFFILAPSSSFIPIVTEVGAERRMYMPLAAVLTALGVGIAALVRRFTERRYHQLDSSAVIACWSSILTLALIFGVSSHFRNRVYHSFPDLYGHIPRTFPWNERGNNNYAKICIDESVNDPQKLIEAELHLNQALRIDPEYSDAFTNRGIVYHRRHDLARAIQNATEAIRWNPGNLNAWNNRGNAFVELKMFNKAEIDFTQIIRLNPNGIEGYYGRANTYYLAGQSAKALVDIDQVIARVPHDFRAFNTRGNILKQMGSYDKAIDAFSRGIGLLLAAAASGRHPSLPAINLAMKKDISRHGEVLQFGERKTLATILGNRAEAYRNLIEKHPKEAKENMFDDLTRAMIMDPENPAYFLARGQQHFIAKSYQQALNDFAEALKRQPSLDAFRGHILSAYELKNWDIVWQDAKTLRDNNAPVDDTTLNKWRQESGRDYPQ